MLSMKIFWRCPSILPAILVATCGSFAHAQEKSFDPSTVELQHFRSAAPKPTKRAQKVVVPSANPPAGPASAQREGASPSAWSGVYGGGNVGAASGDEKNSR
jgi:hypothetical protein